MLVQVPRIASNRLRWCIFSFVLVAIELGFSRVSNGELPLPPVPADLGAPDWVKPGTRITYHDASAVVAAGREQVVLDANGFIVARDGTRYSAIDSPTAAGQGYRQVIVGYVDRQTAVTLIRSYAIEITSGSIHNISSGGRVDPAHTAGEYWVHPARLKQLVPQDTPQLKILRTVYQLDGRKCNAVRIHSTSEKGFWQYTYDLDTGVMLSAGSSTAGASVGTLVQGRIAPAEGNTQITQTRLISIRDVKLPWNGMPAPPIIGQTRALSYAGMRQTAVANSVTVTMPMTMKLSFTRTGPGWAQYVQDVFIQNTGGIPPTQARYDLASGTSLISGLWVPPEELAKLQPGQVLDEDPSTKIRYGVASVDGNGVNLVEANTSETRECMYDRRSGLLIGSVQTQLSKAATNRWTLMLQKQE